MNAVRIILVFLSLGLTCPARAQKAGDTTAGKLKADVQKAYQDTRTFKALITFKAVDTKGEKPDVVQMTTQFAFDRPSNSFRYDVQQIDSEGNSAPSTTVVSDGQTMWIRDFRPAVRSSNLKKNLKAPNVVVEFSLDLPLKYASLIVDNPVIGKDFLPHMALLMGEDFVAQLARMSKSRGLLRMSRVSPRSDDSLQRPGVKISGWPAKSRFFKTLIYWVDPKTNLITQLTLERESSDQLGVIDVEIESHNQPLDPLQFKFDTTGMKKFDSVRESRGLKK